MSEPRSPSALGPLGKATVYADRYDPALLFSVERAPQRAALALPSPWPLSGHDDWTGWEGSWLDGEGKPRVAVIRFTVPAASPRIVESKSVKLYLTALNDTRFADATTYRDTVERDLSQATGGDVRVQLVAQDDLAVLARHAPPGSCIDDEFATGAQAEPAAAQLAAGGGVVEELLYTRLFRSVCPVTAQPDYASMHIHYHGPSLDRARLLGYLVSFRHHAGFHEHCVERIAADLWRSCAPTALTVTARFTRRGGIDINPMRHAGATLPPLVLPYTPVQ